MPIEKMEFTYLKNKRIKIKIKTIKSVTERTCTIRFSN